MKNASNRIVKSKKLHFAGDSFFVALYEQVSDRLKTTCFRDPRKALAGNFLPDYRGPFDFMPKFGDRLVKDIAELYAEGKFGTWSFKYEDTAPTGWSSTIDIRNIEDALTESFCPNKRSNALRLTQPSKIKAPLTCELTMVVELVDHRMGPMVIIRSMYPGKDIGALNGDITAREGVAFFGWEHLGETP